MQDDNGNNRRLYCVCNCNDMHAMIGPCHHTRKGNNSQCVFFVSFFFFPNQLYPSRIFFSLAHPPNTTLGLYQYSSTHRLSGEVLHFTILLSFILFPASTHAYTIHNTQEAQHRTPQYKNNPFQSLNTAYIILFTY